MIRSLSAFVFGNLSIVLGLGTAVLVRVGQSDREGMQCEPMQVKGLAGVTIVLSLAVAYIPDEVSAQMFEVAADLMLSTLVGACQDPAIALEGTDGHKAGLGFLGLSLALLFEGVVDGAALVKMSPHEGEVDLLHLAVRKIPLEFRGSGFGEREK